MRYLRQFCVVSILVCAFAFSGYAGNIECPAVTSTPPEQRITTEETEGDMNFPITPIIVALIENALSLT
jgi:uncharacterized membrane protein YtjA (UPF0391 family)